MRLATAIFGCALLLAPAPSLAQGSRAVLVDRTVARFHAPETGGVERPHFVSARVLAFEARLEALADPDRDGEGVAYRERHLTAALERHVAETLLAALRIDPEPTQAEIERQIQSARSRLLERSGGEAAFTDASRAEGLGQRDVHAILRRQARASLYLDRMVAPMLDPSDAELAALHRTRRTPFADLSFERIRPGLRRWYIGERLAAALQSFYQNARGRLTLTPIGDWLGRSAQR